MRGYCALLQRHTAAYIDFLQCIVQPCCDLRSNPHSYCLLVKKLRATYIDALQSPALLLLSLQILQSSLQLCLLGLEA